MHGRQLERIDLFQAIVAGEKRGTPKQQKQVERMRFCFGMVCEGWAVMVVAQNLIEHLQEKDKEELSISQAANMVAQSLRVFGKADKTVREGLKYAQYHNLMRLAKKAEGEADYATARLLIKDANELMGLNQEEIGGYENPDDYAQPEIFLYSDDEALVNAVKNVVVVDIDHQVMEEDGEESSSKLLPKHEAEAVS